MKQITLGIMLVAIIISFGCSSAYSQTNLESDNPMVKAGLLKVEINVGLPFAVMNLMSNIIKFFGCV